MKNDYTRGLKLFYQLVTAILKGPQSQVVSAGSDGVTFGCRIKGEAQEWTINGKFSSFPRNQRLIQSGVVFHDRVRVNGMVDSSIIIPATIAFNSTTLVCLATNASISLSGSVAVLTIAGKPLQLAVVECMYLLYLFAC